MATTMAGIRTKFTDDLGLPLIGGQVFTYDAGTSTPKDSYSDQLLTIPNTNPIILDDAGSCDLYLKGVYRLRVLDVNGVLMDERDNVSQADGQFDSVLANTIAIGELQTSVANIEDNSVIKTDVSNRATGYGKPTSATVYASLRSDLWRVAIPTGVDMGELIFTTYDTEQVVNGATIAAGAYLNPDLIAKESITSDKIAKESITGDRIAKGSTLNALNIVDANYSAAYAQTTLDVPNTVMTATGEMKRSNDPLNAASRKVGTLGGNLVERGTDGYPAKNNAIGVGQTWQNVMMSRAWQVTYTNSTGRPINVYLAAWDDNGTGIQITINGESWGTGLDIGSFGHYPVILIIPNGSTYKISNGYTGRTRMLFWRELR